MKIMTELLASPIFYSIESLGIISFALSGVILAKKKTLMLLGYILLRGLPLLVGEPFGM